MAPGYNVALLALDPLQAAVARDLSSRYCPHSVAIFLARFWTIFAIFAAAALLLLFAGNRSANRPRRRTLCYVAAGALLLFAIGAGAFVLYGLSGCSGVPAEGLIWEWP